MVKKDVKYTGERMVPGEVPSIFFFDHLRRYYFISKLCKCKSVLDVGCGNGYGSSILADKAKCVVGIDVEKEDIYNARHTYKKKNLKFILGGLSSKELINKKYDVVCSFEVIEHVNDQDGFVCGIKNLMKKSGISVISTPNKLVVSPNSKKPSNPFHTKEFEYTDSRLACLGLAINQ